MYIYIYIYIYIYVKINPLNAELNPICHLLALLGGATIVVVSRLRVKKVNIILHDVTEIKIRDLMFEIKYSSNYLYLYL